LPYGTWYGIFLGVSAARKITVNVPVDLLSKAQKSTGEGVTETVRRGLQLVAAGAAYRKIRSLRGKVRVDLDLERLREDR
jgi:hypothetical protein